MFGVTTNARRSSSVFIAATASSSISASPLFAIITGSTTSRGISRSATAAATASTMAAVASMPVLAASGRMSETTVSICAVTKSDDNRLETRDADGVLRRDGGDDAQPVDVGVRQTS